LGRTLGGFIDGLFGIVTAPIKLCLGHRGFIHAPVLAVVFFALGSAFDRNWVTWFAIGYALHLFGDAMTVEGIPVWSPFSSRRVSLTRIRTGSRTEGVVATGLLLLTIILGWSLLSEGVKSTQRSLFDAVWQWAES
jgi:inner membrane protein